MTISELSPTELTTLSLLIGINISKSYTVEELEILVSMFEVLIGVLNLTLVCKGKISNKDHIFIPKP